MSKYEIEIPVNGKLVKVAKTSQYGGECSLFDWFVLDNEGYTLLLSDEEYEHAYAWVEDYQWDELDLDDDDIKVAELV